MFGSTNNKTLFGQTNTSSAFAQPNNVGFGVGSTTTSTPFGGQQQSMFGASNALNQFGSSASGSTLFGATQPSVSLFGANAANSTANTGFGTNVNTNAFGTNSSLFGAQQQNQSLFGGSRFGSNAISSPFSSSSLTPQMSTTTGTTIKFNATAGTDTMMKNGVSQSINTRHQCITCMREYEMKSLEELRIEDYQANRKGPQTTNLFGSSAVSGNNMFGTTASPQNTFASTSNTGLFGQNKTSFGTLAPTTTTNSGLFGPFGASNKSMFGTPNTAFPSVQTQPQQQSIFGNPSATNTSLSQSSFFSSGVTNTTASVKPLFGNTNTQTQPLFGNPNVQNTKPLFGNPTSTAQPFGTNSSNLFNTGNTGTLFSSSQPSLFNAGTTAATNTLSKPLFTFSSQPSMTLNPTLGTSGGTTGSLFGTNLGNSFGNTGSLFTNTSSNFNFNPTQTFQANNFQSPVGLMSTPAQTSSPELLVTRFQTFPYGDSPHLQIDVNISTNSKVKTKFTTDPRTLNQYKISAKSFDNKPKRIANNTGSANTMLFDGLDDNFDEYKTAKDVFVPRRNIKKLVLKNKNVSQSSSFDSLSSVNSSQLNEKNNIFDESPLINTTVQDIFNDNNRRVSKENLVSKERLSTGSFQEKDSILSSGNSESSEQQNASLDCLPVVPKCGVILTRSDYYTIPTIEELDLMYDITRDVCVVDSFTVGRHNYGSIYWDGPIDVKGINLDEFVHIRRKEVIVYPDDDAKPNNGEGLNRAAQITLHQVWPIDKTTHEIIKDIDRLRSMKYAEKIESATIKLGATFKEYRAETGSWVFTVKHFSKYGLLDDDDDDEDGGQQINQAVNQTQHKQITATKDISKPLHSLSSKQSMETSAFNQFSFAPNLKGDDLFNKSTHFKDNTLSFLHIDETEVYDEIDKQSIENDNFKNTSDGDIELDQMRNVLFDDYDDMATSFKKTKKSNLVKISDNVKSPQTNYFSPVIKIDSKPMLSIKLRSLDFKPDTFAAVNKISCDISSICVSSSPKISFFNASSRFTLIKDNTILICDLSLINFDDSKAEKFNEQLKNNSNLITPTNKSEVCLPFIETKEFARNSRANIEMQQLIEALYGNLNCSSPYAHHKERISRIQFWLYSYNKKLTIPSETFARIIHFLSTNELEAAVNEALDAKSARLASLLSCGSNVNKDLMVAQLDSWKSCKADKFIDSQILKIYILLSGQIKWCTSDGTEINAIKELKWTQQLSLILLYMNPTEVSNEELGVDLLKTSISQITAAPEDVEYHLLSRHTPWVAMSSSRNLLDSWFLHESLKCYHVIIDDKYELSSISDAVHCSIASQLTDIRWACFVALHIKYDFIRETIIKEIIGRNINVLERNDKLVQWLKENLLLPESYIFEAKAIKAKSCFDYKNLALNFIECNDWAEAHEVLMEHVFPDMVINEEHDNIMELISRIKPHSNNIPNWYSCGAHIYETYLQCLHSSSIELIKSFNIHQLKCNTKKHILCQSEMTRKANIIYSELCGEFAYNTPIPDDYALLELKTNAKKMVKMLC